MVLGCDIIRRLLHWCPGKCRRLVRLSHTRLGVHPLDWDDASEVRVVSRLGEICLARLRARVVGDEVKVLPS